MHPANGRVIRLKNNTAPDTNENCSAGENRISISPAE
jgi:hypothetical protein